MELGELGIDARLDAFFDGENLIELGHDVFIASLVRRAVFPPRNDSRPTTDIRYFIHESISGSR
ncbi:MAG: hypothetical protein HC794_10445 [Nitrospiraceae bacterium]|nr:hypothetical protein [Nitrospiraceae bacterium]